ncbi:MAG: Lrp/AsnC family transcriptional regulator [Comamonas sp.]|jgi:DNA-binding Lrp family transcriptional regulator|nr:Lrp/AsnC family transcriptional regulator [Comamonas sp.]
MNDDLNDFTLDIIDLQLLDALQKDASVSNQALADKVHVSPPTCLRRIKRLREMGLIAAEVALLSHDVLAKVQGFGLFALVEVSLDRQGAEALDAFEAFVVQNEQVQQCWRVSPGPDFVLVVYAHDMPGYLALTQKLFTAQSNVRNVKTYFATKRSKFITRIPLPKGPHLSHHS